MDDASRVGRIEGVGDLHREIEQQRQWQRLRRGEPAIERLPFQTFQHQITKTVVVADIVNRADERMVQRGDRAGLALETPHPIAILRKSGGKNLEGDMTSQP